MARAAWVVLWLAGCGGTAAGPAGDAGSAGDAATLAADGGSNGGGNAVSSCEVMSMNAIYPGPLPPNPYSGPVRATDCILAEHDAIIVLGCPANSDGTASTCQSKRADIAVALASAGFGSRFIVSGAAAHNEFVEAEVLKSLLRDRGVAENAIWLEPNAYHTDENIYYSSLIMQAQGWQNAVVVTEDPGQLIYTAVCDSNCCVDLGRLTVAGFPITLGSGPVVEKLGHYVRYPWAGAVSSSECDHIEQSSKAMCTNLSSRRACAGRITLP